MTLLRYVRPMGIYETLYAFLDSFGSYMGDAGTHPWSQGFPRTDQIPGGPPLPDSVSIGWEDLRYPKAWGLPALRESIAGYYNHWYDAGLSPENIMVFAGGRPAIVSTLLFLDPDATVRIASTEYTPYYDLLERLGRKYELVDSSVANGFRPTLEDYLGNEEPTEENRQLVLLSNPCNPTGVTRSGEELAKLVTAAKSDHRGVLVDEAYEFFHDPPVSALAHIDDIDDSNLFVIGAATKGLQAPGIRVGWIVASKEHVEILSNFSSFGMGGVSHPSQLYAVELFEKNRIEVARQAVPAYYGEMRSQYAAAFKSLGLELFSGDGGFYHWCRLPEGLTAEAFNQRLFSQGAAVLKGTDCDMARLGDASPLANFFRFSFGPLSPESFDSDIEIMRQALQG